MASSDTSCQTVRITKEDKFMGECGLFVEVRMKVHVFYFLIYEKESLCLLCFTSVFRAFQKKRYFKIYLLFGWFWVRDRAPG